MQKRHGLKIASGLVMGSSMMLMTLLPAASAMAATMPMVTSVTLGAAQGTPNVGNTVKFTATATQSGSGTPMYNFWYQGVKGNWHSNGWSASNSFSLPALQSGSYEVVVYSADKGQTTPVNSEGTNSNQFVNVNSTLTVTTNAKDVAPLSPVTITAQSTNLTNPVYQYWLGTPNGNGGYNWAALNVNGSNGDYSPATSATFTPPTSGTYQISVFAKDLNAPQNDLKGFGLNKGLNESVYGTASAVNLSAAKSSLVADGQATDTITATVVDSNGNTVANYNGQVEIPPVTGLTFTNVQGTALVMDNATGNYEVPVSNGVGQFQVAAATSLANTTGTLTSEDLSGVGTTSITYGSTPTLTFQQLSASSIGLSASSAYLSDNSSSNTDTLTATINDQANQPLASGSSVYVTFTINGNATFADGSKTYSEYVTPNGSTGTPISISAIQGQGGTISVSASASGLTSPTPVQIQAVQTSAPSTFSLTSKAEMTSSNTPYTLYTAQLLDASGIPVAPASGSPDALTISDNTGTVGGTLNYYPVVNGTPDFTTAYTAATLPGADLRASNNGQFQFAVENSTVGSSNATISVTDALTGVTKTAGYAFAAGSPARALLPGDSFGSYSSGTYNVEAGQTATFKINLTDAAGNSLTTSGQAVDVYFSGSANGATINGSSNWTSSNPFVVDSQNGVATVSVAVPSGATSGFTLGANVVGHTTMSSIAASVVGEGQYTTQLGLGGSPGTPNINYSLPTSMSAGQTLFNAVTTGSSGSLYAVPLNAVGASTGTNDSLTITSSNSNVLQIGNGSSSSVTQGSSNALPTITAMQAGTATLTITDTSDNAMPMLKETISVAAGAATQLQAMNPDGTTNTAYTFATSGVVGPFTIQTTDAGGNVAPVTAPVGLTAGQIETILGVSNVTGIRTSASGSDVSTVTIPQGQASVQVWVDGATASTSTSPTVQDLNTQTPALVSTSGSGNTVTLTFDGAVQQVPTSAATFESDFTVMNGGVTDAVTGASVNGQMVTLNLTNALSINSTVAVAANTLASGYGANNGAIAATAISGAAQFTSMTATAPTGTVTAGALTHYTLTMNNSSFNGTLNISSVTGGSNGPTSGTFTPPTTATFVNGVASVPVTLYEAAAQTLEFTVDGITSTGDTAVTPVAAAAQPLALRAATAATAAAASGTYSGDYANSVTVGNITDAYGNVIADASALRGTDFTVSNGTSSTVVSGSVSYVGSTGVLTFYTTAAQTSSETWTVTYTNTTQITNPSSGVSSNTISG